MAAAETKSFQWPLCRRKESSLIYIIVLCIFYTHITLFIRDISTTHLTRRQKTRKMSLSRPPRSPTELKPLAGSKNSKEISAFIHSDLIPASSFVQIEPARKPDREVFKMMESSRQQMTFLIWSHPSDNDASPRPPNILTPPHRERRDHFVCLVTRHARNCPNRITHIEDDAYPI